MERFGSVQRLVAKDLSEQDTEFELLKIRERFEEQHFPESFEHEREKTSEELQIIELANERMNDLRESMGLSPFVVPVKNIHLIPKEHWHSDTSRAFHWVAGQFIAMTDTASRLEFANTLYHELAHFNSYTALQWGLVTGKRGEYRLGLSCFSRDLRTHYFKALNEAVTEELARRFTLEVSQDPLFLEETEQTAGIKAEFGETAKNKYGEPVTDDETYFATITHLEEGNFTIKASTFAYRAERVLLDRLIDMLAERNQDRFKGCDEVFALFAKAMLQGNLMPLARLLDRTFGKGTYRAIGELNDDVVGLERYIEALQ